MSKETSSKEATVCACGGTFAFPEQHWQHCPMNPDVLGKTTEGRKVLSQLGAKFSKAQLATIAAMGPQRDEKLKSRRKGRG